MSVFICVDNFCASIALKHITSQFVTYPNPTVFFFPTLINLRKSQFWCPRTSASLGFVCCIALHNEDFGHSARHDLKTHQWVHLNCLSFWEVDRTRVAKFVGVRLTCYTRRKTRNVFGHQNWVLRNLIIFGEKKSSWILVSHKLWSGVLQSD